MKAVVLTEAGLQLQSVPSPVQPSHVSDPVTISIHAAALNKRDLWITQGMYAKIALPSILGSDCCGVVTNAPNHPELTGQRVVVNPSINWGTDAKAQGSAYQVLGMPSQGTLAEAIVVDKANVFEAPKHLSTLEAAALPLAGVTAYRALFVQGLCNASSNVLITGIGGGVALLAMQFAIASGAAVWVSSTSDEKIRQAVAAGARGGVNINSSTWIKDLQGMSNGIDLIIDSVGGNTVNDLLNLIQPGGRIVFYGSTLGAGESVNMHRIFWKQITIVGSTMGTTEDFRAMLSYTSEHRIRPHIDSVFPLEHAQDAFSRLDGSHTGKIVVTLPGIAS